MPKKQIKKKLKKTPSRKKAKSSLIKKAKRKPASKKTKAAKKPARKPSRTKRKPLLKKTKAAKRTSSTKRKATLKKSLARKAIRSAVAKRVTRKPHTKKATSKSAKKRASKKPRTAGKLQKNSAKKPVSKSKVRKTRAKKAGSKSKAVSKPPTKSERLGGELNRADISKLLSDRYTRHLVIDSGGEYALEIIRGFSNNSSDEDMAKKLKIKISDVRATLNKLHSLGVVDYTRHKDSETGWFSYYWFLNVERMKEWVNKKIEDDHRRMDFSNGEHYYCPGCGGASIHTFVSASDFGFKCPTCSSSLDFLSEEKANDLFPMRSFRKPLL